MMNLMTSKTMTGWVGQAGIVGNGLARSREKETSKRLTGETGARNLFCFSVGCPAVPNMFGAAVDWTLKRNEFRAPFQHEPIRWR